MKKTNLPVLRSLSWVGAVALVLGSVLPAQGETATVTQPPAVVNQPPVVTITAPVANATVPITGFTVKGTASDPAGNPAGVARVLLTGKVGTITLFNNAPVTYNAVQKSWEYRASGNVLKTGSATFTAVAIDRNGARSIPKTVRVTIGLPPGDANGNGRVEYADAILLLNYLFQGGPRPTGNTDANGDGRTDISDSIAIFQRNPTFGDFNADGRVDVDDLIGMLMRIASNSPATAAQLACCDTNGDRQITGEDAALVLRSDRRTQSK